MKKDKTKVLNDTSNLEREIGHLVANAEVKGDVSEWLEKCDGNIAKCLVIWTEQDSGKLKVFGTNMKAVEAIGYLEVAKADLLDFLCEEDEETE